MKIETWFDVLDTGEKLWNNLLEYQKQVKNLKPARYTVSIEKVENIRSKEQNNSLWAIPYKFLQKVLIETGTLPEDCSKEQVHEWAMVNCLPENYRERIYEEWKNKPGTINIKTGEVYKQAFRLTTTKMRTIDCMQYYKNMQDCYAQNFSSGEIDDFIPDPKKDYKKLA